MDTITMFSSYRIGMTPFQFSYRIGLLFPLEHIFSGMIFVTKRRWNAPILKVVRRVSDGYRSAPKNWRKHIWNYNCVWFIFKIKIINSQLLMKYFFSEGLVMFEKEVKIFYKTKQLNVKTPECNLQLLWDKIL